MCVMWILRSGKIDAYVLLGLKRSAGSQVCSFIPSPLFFLFFYYFCWDLQLFTKNYFELPSLFLYPKVSFLNILID